MTRSELRHFCRHCRSKLKAPVANHREAFDSKGCHGAFYRHRCLVCEGTCRGFEKASGPAIAPTARADGSKSLFQATFWGCPGCKWEGGSFERLAKLLAAAEKAEIEASEPDWKEVISPDGVRCFVASPAARPGHAKPSAA
jgi:hypothetical protein